MPSRSSAPSACPACGTSLGAADRFCSSCGRAVGRDDPAADGRPGPEDRAWLDRRVADLRAEGWDPVADDGDRVVLRDRGVGSLPVHAALLVFTGGIGNLVYALYRYTSGAPRLIVDADGTERRPDERDTDLRSVATALVAGTLAFSAVVMVGVAVLASLSEAALAAGGLAIVALALAAATAIPSIARDGRESITTFGRRRTVDRDRVRNPPDPCAACGSRVFRGEHRRYAERLYIAGVPVRTASSGANTYCASCADEAGDPAGDDVAAEPSRVRDAADDAGGRERSRERSRE
ncbi:hypothetical protein Hbl1158_10540 [Halobaculum sp. CBA1158]|uniref:hypothetical protein n=1 Tax=Halobaculum sp. CBA1158 TaxID=2904243 RepID=UPI001F347F46|nr:hypothetical protein [Halobaculum sp. CBA1158]UIO98971.1 hypothetical protein Hbl1158_10540 [Halobaculum sp. CBA1158]